MKKIHFAVLLLLISTVWSCTNTGKTDKLKNYHVIDGSRIVQDSAYYEVQLEFPIFVANDEKDSGPEKINAAILSLLDTAAAYYWGVEMDSVKFFIDEAGSSAQYALSNKYRILDTTGNVISILMETYSYALGAHGFTALHTYNFDIEQNRFLSINDLLDFSKPDNILQLNKILKDHFENPEGCFNDTPTADGNFELFGIEPENLVFFYEAYELGAYYCGIARVSVPIEELKKAGLWKNNPEY